MIVAKKKYMTLAMIATVFILTCIFIVPKPYQWIGLLVGYLCLLLVMLSYNKTLKTGLTKIKALDENRQFKQVIEYANQLDSLGYRGFVIDSYVLYAHYELGDFKSYEQTVLRISNGKQWSRPKFASFKAKVMDNLACINLLKHWADTGEVQYKGSNLMMMQAVDFYSQSKSQDIINLMNEYPQIPKLKKVCLYALSGQFDAFDNYYESDIANDVLNKIKERNRNG